MELNLDTIILFVRDMDKQKAFYVGILQLAIEEEWGNNWLLLKAGGCKIGLHQIGEEYLVGSEADWKVDSNTKLVFELKEDIHEVRTRLVAQNVALEEVRTFDNYGFWFCEGADPEGNVFQLKQKKALSK